jgi:ABC-2 type transport system permease protein
MGAVAIIFRRELGAYLTSAMGYVVAAVTLLLAGLLFYGQALGPAAGARMSTDVLTRFFFTTSGLVSIAAVVLSTRLLAEERQLETLALLNTSPINDAQIVVGKYLSALAFLTFITALSLYMPLMILVNGKVSLGQVAVGYLGLVLLGSAVISIGVLASSLTRHSMFAAFLGAAFTGIMFLFWPLALVIPYPLSVVFQGIAIHGRHFTGFEVGVLQLKDIVYYLAVTYFFLLMSVKVMEAKRWE